MRDIVLGIITRLKANTALATAVSTRIYRRGSVPKSPTVPYVLVSTIDSIRDIESSTVKYGHSRVQCSVFASTDLSSANISELIADSLHRLTNTTLNAGTGSVYVISVKDGGTTPDENSEIPVYMYHRDFMIIHSYN